MRADPGTGKQQRTIAFVAMWAIACGQAGVLRAQSGRFIVTGGEAYDRKTGLIWQRCSAGRAWQAGRCAGQLRKLTWFDAMALQDGKWRVPTQPEMQSLFEQRAAYPKIDTQVFDQTPEDVYYWTSTRLDMCLENAGRECAQVVGFNGASAAYSPFGGIPGIHHMPVRLVRDGPAPAPPAPAATGVKTTADGRWAITGGEAFDKTTGLTWQRCDAGKTFAAGLGCRGKAREYTWQEAIGLQQAGWRLPAYKELATLFYHGPLPNGHPLLDPEVFLEIDPNHATYWASNPYFTDCAHCKGPFCAGNCEYDGNGNAVSKFVWCVNFNIGWSATDCLKTRPAAARLVRSAR